MPDLVQRHTSADPRRADPEPTGSEDPRASDASPRAEVWGRGRVDPFAIALDDPTAEFERRRMGSGPISPADPMNAMARGGPHGSYPSTGQPGSWPGSGEPVGATPAQDSPLDQVGRRTASTLRAIDFPAFVAGLIKGTFDALVRSSEQQMRAFADLVATLAQTVDEFAEQHISPAQVRAWLVESFPRDLQILTPAPGSGDAPRLVPTRGADGSSPAWLSRFDASGQELDDDFTDGPLVLAAQRSMAQRQMHQLATLVLMGVNRIVVDRGDITAKLQFHIEAQDNANVVMGAGASGGAAQSTPFSSGTEARLSVSTVGGNVQRDSMLRADLMGQVSVRFSSETFPLERFADSAAIQLINSHAVPQPAKGSTSSTAERTTVAKADKPVPAAPKDSGS